MSHVPCDIVLVIDVSGSMGADAPVPTNPGERSERFGLSVLDLVKHAALTILETLDDRDRLGIVTFATKSKVIQPLTFMNKKNKKKAKSNIESMYPLDMTNLWHGIRDSLGLFDGDFDTGRVPAVMVLTDGLPNHMCPPQGYVPKLRKTHIPATIHTFGFGYSLRSGLLKSIAETGGGNYAFIPDAGMIGTVFVHAVANLQSTYANNASLRLNYPGHVNLYQTTGPSADTPEPIQVGGSNQLTIPLGNIQYGQSRDIYLRYDNNPTNRDDFLAPPILSAVLEFNLMTSQVHKLVAHRSLSNFTTMTEAEIAYHVSRSKICGFLSSLYPLRSDFEHNAVDWHFSLGSTKLRGLVATLPAANYADTKNVSLMEDLSAPEPKGQVLLALSRQDYWKKWGAHYLLSLLNAHAKQICNSFKDPGPLQYGVDSPLFIQCRDRLDEAFDNLPAPKPSNYTEYRGPIYMSSYNSSSNPCFAGCSTVTLANGKDIAVSTMRKGMRVATPLGPRRVVAILKTPVRREIMCKVRGLLVTPWHPVSLDGKSWAFPSDIADGAVRYSGAIYSILLQKDRQVDAHAVKAGGLWGVTLGHGLLAGDDVRAHHYLGNYSAVVRSLKGLRLDHNGVALGGGVKRSKSNGLVCGFKKPTVRRREVTPSALVQTKVVYA